MATTAKLLAAGDDANSASYVTIYTAPANTTAIIKTISYANDIDSGTAKIAVKRGAGDEAELFKIDLADGAGSTFLFRTFIVLEAGDLLRIKAPSATLNVAYTVSGVEITPAPTSKTPKLLAHDGNATMSDNYTTIYEVPANTDAIIKSIAYYNTEVSDDYAIISIRRPGVGDMPIYIVHLSAQSNAPYLLELVLHEGDKIEIKDDAGPGPTSYVVCGVEITPSDEVGLTTTTTAGA